jgi:EAL and modified HD-GYP domain-containing signal transduction protein
MTFIRSLVSGLFQAKDPANQPRPVVRPIPVTPKSAPAPQPIGLGSALDNLIEVGSRRPVIASAGKVIGYEFCLPPRVIDRLSVPNEQRAKSAYVLSLIASARLVGVSGKIGFAKLQAHWLGPEVPLQDCTGVWVCIESAVGPSAQQVGLDGLAALVRRLQAAHAKVGWEATYAGIGASNFGLSPDFVVMHQGETPFSALVNARKSWPQSLLGLPTLATDLSSEDDLELAMQEGISYACGAFHGSSMVPGPASQQRVPPGVARLTNLMNLLVSDAELSAIANEIKGDVGLSYRLLNLMQGAKFASRYAALSVEQAVMALGRDELYRILSIMLLRFGGTRKVSSALEEVALCRARFLELLAIERGEQAPGHFFTMGLVSLLSSLFRQDLAVIAGDISMADEARRALLQQDGPWNDYLRVAMHVEAQDLDPHSPLAAAFGGPQRIHALSDAAWVWASEQSTT